MVKIRHLTIIVVLYYALTITVNGQMNIHNNKNENVMEIIYEQKENSLSILLEYSIKDNSYQWETRLINNKTKKQISLLLDKKEKKNSLLQEKNGNDSVQLYSILGAYIDEKTIYIVYEKWGIVSLYSFQFTTPEIFTSSNRELTGHFVTPAYGALTSNAVFKNIKSSIYLLLNIGQNFNTQTSSALYLISDIHNISKISFLEPFTQIMVAYGLSANAQSFLANVKDENQLSGNTLKYYDFVKQFKDKPYYFKKLSLDKNKRVNELYELQIQGLSLYDIYDSTHLNNKNEKIIKEILLFYGINGNVKYLDPLVDKRNSSIYFFYSDADNYTQIISYKKEDFIWEIYKCTLETIQKK